jgi:hypothetical protein
VGENPVTDVLSTITVDDFKAYFVRDFFYYTSGDSTRETITDNDLTKALFEAKVNFNPGLFPDDDTIKVAYMYLCAHYLCVNVQTAATGINSVGYCPVNSRSVGDVSESYEIPEWLKKDPTLYSYNTTRYGQLYLSIVRPLLIGNVHVFKGWTTP